MTAILTHVRWYLIEDLIFISLISDGLGIFSYVYRSEVLGFIYFLFFKYFIHIFLDRGEGKEKQRKRNTDVWEKHRSVASHMLPNQGPNCNPGLCPDRESNQRHFALRDDSQPTEPHQPGLEVLGFIFFIFTIMYSL